MYQFLSFDKHTTVREDVNIQSSSVKGKELSVLFFTTFWVNLKLFQNTVFKKPPQNVACWGLVPMSSL